MLVEEMAKQSMCCINFLQELLKTTVNSSEEDYISLTVECRINFEVHVSAKFDGEGCYTLPVCMEETYIGEALCDFGVNVNLISLVTARDIHSQMTFSIVD